MSTFGEIVEPSTRAAWEEDWDDDAVLANNLSQLNWSIGTEAEIENEIDTFYILEGKYLSDSFRNKRKSVLKLINSIPKVNLCLYKVGNNNNYVCTIQNYDLVLSTEILELLRKYIVQSRNVITLELKPKSEFKSLEMSSHNCVIRRVSTSKSQDLLHYKRLEQPNIIYGVAAGAISLRQHLNLPATGLVSYLEHLEEYSIDTLQKLLGELQLSELMESNTTSVLDSNLYV